MERRRRRDGACRRVAPLIRGVSAIFARGIRDLHDLPLRCLPEAERMIDNYASIALVMERRKAAQG